MFQGAGEAALGIANLCVMAMVQEGLSREEAKKRVWLVDSKGLIVKDRPKGGISEHKTQFAHEHEPIDTLAEAVDKMKPTILIGAAAIPGAFTPEILAKMAELNAKPVIFALSNPTSKAEVSNTFRCITIKFVHKYVCVISNDNLLYFRRCFSVLPKMHTNIQMVE